ncbi:MAG TPA: 50S ribosomal protein L11 [Candidatus Syntrophoarchaeum butanivorans]|uniref:Large ribosomal subunit protein uL11 n=1 Tax=Candidatus Syntropharchaeum butanivorans TaxID=1839936 RepID=A0A7C1BB75_9EURY|nr:MAG: 50S ribosomal protein L11 [Candidatus Syntrophoarchaeum sp. WYZ-LMO15]HDM36982.1 50S ribosomal protein L11 [Candidatus Syntrophoarchaeum butanivorans]
MPEVIEVLVTAGKATAGPPLGPALGPLGVNIKEVVDEINRKTQGYEGMQVPVIITVEGSDVNIEVGSPPTSALIKKELGIEVAKREDIDDVVGNLTIEQVINIAKMKIDSMLSSNLKNALKEVLGTCVSMGVTVDGLRPKEVQRRIDRGEYDHLFAD